MWSLAVEEQYYLLLPLALLALPRRMWMAAILVGTFASLAAYAWFYPRSPGATFYLLPTRAWEIGLGALGARLNDRPGAVLLARRVRSGALVALGAAPFLTPALSVAHWLALAVCLATLALVLAGQPGPFVHSLLRPLARVGDMSDSLYLVHWPIFAFAHVLSLGAPIPAGVIVMLIAGILVLSALLHHFVEQPCRRSRLGGWRLCALRLRPASASPRSAMPGCDTRADRAPARPRRATGLDLPGRDPDAVPSTAAVPGR